MEKINKTTLIAIIILLVGIVISVYLALNYQTILSHAGSSDYNHFTVTQKQNGQDIPVTCDSSGNCQTQSLDVKLKINNLDQLTQ